MNLERIKTLNPNVELLIVRETLEGVEKLFNKNGFRKVENNEYCTHLYTDGCGFYLRWNKILEDCVFTDILEHNNIKEVA